MNIQVISMLAKASLYGPWPDNLEFRWAGEWKEFTQMDFEAMSVNVFVVKLNNGSFRVVDNRS